jgi:hypothetical protein
VVNFFTRESWKSFVVIIIFLGMENCNHVILVIKIKVGTGMKTEKLIIAPDLHLILSSLDDYHMLIG